MPIVAPVPISVHADVTISEIRLKRSSQW